jgi:hypothetical protein
MFGSNMAKTVPSWQNLAETLVRVTKLFGQPRAAKRYILGKLISGEWSYRYRDEEGNLHRDDRSPEFWREIDGHIRWDQNWATRPGQYQPAPPSTLEDGIHRFLDKAPAPPRVVIRPPLTIYGIEICATKRPPPSPPSPPPPASNRDLIRAEAKRRIEAGTNPRTLKNFAAEMESWWEGHRPPDRSALTYRYIKNIVCELRQEEKEHKGT